MVGHHRKVIFLQTALLLLRFLVPIVHGQLNRPEWNGKVDIGHPYRESFIDKISNAIKSNEESALWSPMSDIAVGNSPTGRDSGDPTPVPLRIGFEQPQTMGKDKYLLPKSEQYVQKINAGGMGYAFNRPPQQQRSKTQQIGVSLDSPFTDYTYDDIAQQLQPDYYPSPSSNTDNDVSGASVPVKAKMKPREAGLSRYLVFSNFKRARDGYMCHFKLCQVGVSGKRLSM